MTAESLVCAYFVFFYCCTVSTSFCMWRWQMFQNKRYDTSSLNEKPVHPNCQSKIFNCSPMCKKAQTFVWIAQRLSARSPRTLHFLLRLRNNRGSRIFVQALSGTRSLCGGGRFLPFVTSMQQRHTIASTFKLSCLCVHSFFSNDVSSFKLSGVLFATVNKLTLLVAQRVVMSWATEYRCLPGEQKHPASNWTRRDSFAGQERHRNRVSSELERHPTRRLVLGFFARGVQTQTDIVKKARPKPSITPPAFWMKMSGPLRPSLNSIVPWGERERKRKKGQKGGRESERERETKNGGGERVLCVRWSNLHHVEWIWCHCLREERFFLAFDPWSQRFWQFFSHPKMLENLGGVRPSLRLYEGVSKMFRANPKNCQLNSLGLPDGMMLPVRIPFIDFEKGTK